MTQVDKIHRLNSIKTNTYYDMDIDRVLLTREGREGEYLVIHILVIYQ